MSAAVIAETGARRHEGHGQGDRRAEAKYAGQMDFGKASGMVKAALTGVSRSTALSACVRGNCVVSARADWTCYPKWGIVRESSFPIRQAKFMSASAAENVDATRPLLFQPFRIRDLTLKNRLVVPPMVHYRAEPGSTCGIFHNVHLGRYALGGFGLVFVEATGVEEIGLINEHDLGIWNDAQVEASSR